ncbi:MAG: Fur family transcriptional regulator [Bdellovibrionia bacterium]
MTKHSCRTELKTITLEGLETQLKNSGLKSTLPRRQLLKMLLEHGEPLSAEEALDLQKSGMDLVTIYRSLKKFEEVGLVQRLEFGDGIARFELVAEHHHHHHVICKNCQKVDVIHMCNVEPHLEAVRKMGYTQVTHRLEFFGLCRECSV